MATTITIQFEGLCCHVMSASGPRVILIDASAHAHESYIEVYPGDFDAAKNPGWTFTGVYARWGREYQRTSITNAKVELVNPLVSSAFTVTGSFHQRIPKLSLVEPSFTAIHADLLQAVVPTNRVAAHFDMSRGFLSAGPSETFSTRFDPEKLWSQRRLGECAQLEVDIDNAAPPTFRVTDLATGTSRLLILEPSATLITLGNQLLDDILGIPPASGRRGHFHLYYDLAASALDDRPEPIPGLGLSVGCSNSNFP